MKPPLTLADVREAHARIAPYVLRTPTLVYERSTDCTLLCKAESLQSTGAFKIRGAFNFLLTLPADCPGVVAHSSGNHAQAVARAARLLGIPATIVMPSDAPRLKLERTRRDGAEVVIVGPDSEERARKASELSELRGLVAVPPFDHPLIAAGQGTAALEMVEEIGTMERFYAPCSGGGLMAGCATALHELQPECELIGVEPEDANDTEQSLAAGERRSVPPPQTIADGLRVRTPGVFTWPILKARLSRVELVSDKELLQTMAWALRELRLVLEPSGAAALAVALRDEPGRSGVLLSGGNVEPSTLALAMEFLT